MTITIFHAPRTRSIRVRWLLEEMGLDYDLHRVEFTRGDVGGEDYRKITPLQKVPAIKDGDVVMVESIAILQYITRRYGPTELAPMAEDAAYPDYLQYLHFGESGMNIYVSMLLGHTALLPEEQRVPGIAKWAEAETRKCLGVIDHGLKGHDWLAADRFTAADISVGYMLFLLKLIGKLEPTASPAIMDYWERLTAREGWKAAAAD